MSGVKDSVRQQFGRAAADYAKSAVHAGGPDLEALVAAAPLSRDAVVLDVGTGAGHTAFALSPFVARVEALDLTEAMLAQVAKGAALRGLSNVHPRLGDAETLPYPDDHFEIVTSRLCAHHFQHPRAFVAEASRVLRPGGCLLLSDSVAPEEPALDTFLNTFELLRDPSHVRNHTASDWQRMFGEAGLEGERLGSFLLLQEFEDWVARMNTAPTAVAQLRHMFEHAGAEARREFAITGAGGSPASLRLGIPSALFRARRPA